jgi:hypothetical protein
MQEMLEGRLEWERSARGIAVKIPARRGSAFTLFGPIIGAWMLLSSLRYSAVSGVNTPDDGWSQIIWIVIGGFGVSFCVFLFWLAWAFTSDTLLTLDETQFKVQRRVLGIELVTNSYSTQDVHNFKYIPPAKFWAGKNEADIRTSKIEFQVKSRFHVIGHGMTQAEAQVLIKQIHKVFKFPEYLAAPRVPLVS